ncbi:MAG: L-threonylcarbamoyladenylate synthase [Wenzhouxiangella sp.]
MPTIQQAIETLNRGGVIAYPTEAVYGLGCRADDRAATERICALKDRSVDQGVIVLIRDLAQLGNWIEPLDGQQQARLNQTWPGPVTWLLPVTSECPDWLRGRHSSLAVRLSEHPICQQLVGALKTPLVSTSANPSGKPPARSATEVQTLFGDTIDAIVDAPLGEADKPSTIFDLRTGQQLR